MDDGSAGAGPGGRPDNAAGKNRVRSAWLSFTSRILAQLVGAAATVVFAVLFLQKHEPAHRADAPAPAAAPAGPQAAAWRRTPGTRISLAVLPFENLSGDARHEALANALTESLITALSQTDDLSVISRTSSMHYKGLQKALPEIARELRVDWIVEGSVLRSGDRVRVVGQVIDADTDEHVWAATFDRPFRDVLALQTTLSASMAGDVRAAVTRHGARPAVATSGAAKLP